MLITLSCGVLMTHLCANIFMYMFKVKQDESAGFFFPTRKAAMMCSCLCRAVRRAKSQEALRKNGEETNAGLGSA